MKKLKYRLVSLLIMTSVVPLFVLGLITAFVIEQMAIREARRNIESSLDISVAIYQRAVDDLKYIIRDANRRVSVLLEEDQIDLLRNEYANYCRRHKLDFFEVTDRKGRVIVSISNPAGEGADISADKFVKRALRFQISVSTEIMESDELQRLRLAGKAALGGHPVKRAMVLKASTPAINRNEMIVGTIQAGYLLNNNRGAILGEIGKRTRLEASVFLGNMRVATSIKPVKTLAPLGETLDKVKAHPVLVNGRRFVGRIPVAGKVFQSGYTPIYDSDSKIIGMLGLGIPEEKVFVLRDRLIEFFAFAVLAAILLSFSIGIKGAARIVNSVKKLRKGIEAFGRGELLYRVDIRSNDELEELGEFYNLTMAQLMTARKQLEDYSIDIGRLENTVNQSSKQLEAAQKRLVECERLAAMGRMATALSHELRNTFAEINSGIYSLKQKLSAAGTGPELMDTVDNLRTSMEYATKILTSVLTFSYPKKPILSKVDVNFLIDDLLAMPHIRGMFRKHNVKIEKSAEGQVPPINADGLQLRELFTNLVVNAAQAMEDNGGGKLSVSIENDQGAIRVKVSDSGAGMSDETMRQLFTPFFTTKSRGLGLGLCIAKSVVEEHGGSIQVYSRINQGTTFIVSLPIVRQETAV